MALDAHVIEFPEKASSSGVVCSESHQISGFEEPRSVTKPSLPFLESFLPYLEEIWRTARLTNGGPFHEQLEERLCEYLGVKHISLFANGTLALLTAMQALEVSGEVITTPYTFIATAHSLHWNQLTPVFVDVDDSTLNLDPSKIEEAITDRTQAIMPVHVYGQPCDVNAIEKIARRNNLRVVYDAAHAFGVRQDGKSILSAGDLSVVSFHATKVFNTFEGGAIISNDAQMKQKIDLLKNFGFRNEVAIVGTGINAKLNEIQAAFGLAQLKFIDKKFESRAKIAKEYECALAGLPGVSFLTKQSNTVYNNSYFPIFLDSDESPVSRDMLYESLRAKNIFARRYFYPLITTFPPYNQQFSKTGDYFPVATKASDEVLCLPIYPELNPEEQGVILDEIYEIFKAHMR